jgi:hypothetical protein
LQQNANGSLYVLAPNTDTPPSRRGPLLNGLPFAPPPPPLDERDGGQRELVFMAKYLTELFYEHAGYAEPLSTATVNSMEPLIGNAHTAQPPRSATISRRQMFAQPAAMHTTGTWNGRMLRQQRHTNAAAVHSNVYNASPSKTISSHRSDSSAHSGDSHYASSELHHSISSQPQHVRTGAVAVDTPRLPVSRTSDTGYSSAPSGSSSPVPRISLSRLHFQSKLGEGEFGEVHLCTVKVDEYVSCGGEPALPKGSIIAVKMLRANASDEAK